ncbi:MAG TPA: NAD(P)H-dependent glycerol-3-phosphate dehydrogenase [Candidatus Cloacimonadota bacterium]|nr:NAD(P)H-dependent glycerol-3-phosphate dehydrogenase [Candidatus Cloacimonadota bacterium]HQL14701.1 NAD(P)H-dependent glycerol-3-phosphate dehydrogenase [Candidatus Cloacimonadota bacterium]
MIRTNFIVLGGGAWGLALAKLLCENGHGVCVWEYNPVYVEILRSEHSNPNLLKDVILPSEIAFSNDLAEILSSDFEYLIFAVPSQFLRNIARSASPLLQKHANIKAIINVAKGIEEHSLKRMSEVLAEELPPEMFPKTVCLSGPSHAEEVAKRIPTAVVIAGKDEKLLQSLQPLFSNEYFRTYRSSDLIGVEIGGAVKNVIAIAAGIIDGLEFGDNTKGALLTRGLAEIRRLGTALGAKEETFLGLSGVGDLFTTAVSKHSRNRYVGYEIGKGKTLPDILSALPSVAEGVASTRSVLELSRKVKVEMPITQEVYSVLFNGKSPRQAIIELMTRSLKSE